MSTIKEITKNTAYIGALRIFSMVVGLLTNIIVVRALGPADFGVYSLILYTAGAIAVFANLGLDQALPRYVAELKVKENYGMIRFLVGKSLKYRLMILIVLSLLLFALAAPLAETLNNPEMEGYFKIIGIILLPQILLAVFSSTYSGLQNFRYITKIGIIFSLLNFALIIVAIKLGARIMGILVAMFISNLISILIYLIHFKKTIPKKTVVEDISFKNRIKKFAISSTVMLFISFFVWDRSGTFFLTFFGYPSEYAGYFAAAQGLIVTTLLTVPNIINYVMLPSMTEIAILERDRLKKYYIQTLKSIVSVTTPIFIFLFFFMDKAIILLYSEKYLPSAAPASILLFTGYLGSITFHAGVFYGAIEQINLLMKIGIYASIVFLISSVILVPQYGIFGAAIAGAMGQLFGLIFGTIQLNKLLNAEIPIKSILKSIFIGLILILPFLYFEPNNNYAFLTSFIIYFSIFQVLIIRYNVLLGSDEINRIKEMILRV